LALEHKDSTHTKWDGCPCCNEYVVVKSDLEQHMWVFQQLPDEWFPVCITPKSKGKGVSLSVWSCF
jgi:hypothetical protein